MIVHDAGDAWEIVLQTDHGDLAGAFAAAWGNATFAPPQPLESLRTVAARHDDGWAVWERWPRRDEVSGGPLPFLAVNIETHFAFYRAALTDITDDDPYAGLLAAMHAAGLYQERYGTQPGLRNRGADQYRDEIARFVAEVEATYPARCAALDLDLDDQERWVNYKLLQTWDRLSLYFSGLFPIRDGEQHTINAVPTDYEGGETSLVLTPLEPVEPSTPRRVTIEPYPFGARPATFRLLRRRLPKDLPAGRAFREAFAAAPVETIEVTIE